MIAYKFRKVIRDGKEIIKLECPGCKIWGAIDNDQFNGRVSVFCECGFHKTVDFSKERLEWEQ